jgi:mannose-6-phosphate isomerase
MTATHRSASPFPTTGRRAETPRSMYDVRPWGSWEVLDVGDGYQVKRINVSPHSRLSLQTHAHRSEHWVVVSGVATCTVGRHTAEVGQGGRVDVPLGAAHRLANERDDELIVLELQIGSYLGEDDILRLADDYGRDKEGGQYSLAR